MPNDRQRASAAARQRMYGALRRFFGERGYQEVETPQLVPHPGMELHLDPFEVTYLPQTEVGTRRPLYLHTSPEYAMKRLVAEGFGPIFQIARVFRNGEISAHHNPEFTLLEFYRPQTDYRGIMEDTEAALAQVELAVGALGGPLFSLLPYERLTVRQALQRHTGIDLARHPDAGSLRGAARAVGVRCGDQAGFDDVFFQLFLERVEPALGRERPTFLYDYPASMAALSRVKAEDPTVAERVELYARGVELANGFSELTDAAEQRLRLVDEQQARRAAGRAAFALDERFLEAVGRMPPCAGIAVGLDRVLMLLLGASSIRDVLLFPAEEYFP